ncbi:MAG: type II secretion system protein M [Luminiphilus sp.]|jgi:general secretion pathway protein M|nr:type II secretion system protein M [Luminiphilus sp.]
MVRQWFESLSARDQIALMILGAAVGLWAFVFLIFIELDGRRERLVDGNQALAQKLHRVDLKVEQLAVLREGGGDGQVNLTRTLSQASETHGLTVKRLQPNSRGEVQLRFEGVAFDGLLQFLEQIEGSAGLVVKEASISSAGRSGGVNATLRIAGN